MSIRSRVGAVFTLVLTLLCTFSPVRPAAAQQRGTVSGKILDPAGLALPGVTVTLTDTARGFTRSVVTEGSGTALRDAPGGEVFGKTGTAEYGTDSPPRTRAWFVGYQGYIAFAVLVEDGRSGGSVAAPIARAFLDAYRAAPTAPAPE